MLRLDELRARISQNAPRSQERSQEQSSGAQVERVPTFNCRTQEELQNGFSRFDVNIIGKEGTSYQLHPGCALIRVTVNVKTLSGSRYLLQEETGPNQYFECGSFSVNGDVHAKNSPSDCAEYLNSYRGKILRAIVQDGGILAIN